MKRTISMWLSVTATIGLLACGDSRSRVPQDDAEGGTTDDGDGDGDGDGDPTGDGDGAAEATTFVMFSDVVGAQCDPWAQDCAEGDKCVPFGSTGGDWDANKCVPVTGDDQAGDTCTWDGAAAATDSCGADTHCWDAMDIDGQLIGVCTPFCDGTPDSPVCGAGTSCLIANEGTITLCVDTCDPLLQACRDGLGCFWANNDFNCIFTAGNIAEGEACGFINDCAPGLRCETAEVLPSCAGAACCAAFCDLLAPECANPQTECVPFFGDSGAPPNYEDIGLCILPGA